MRGEMMCRECGERPHYRLCSKRAALWRGAFLSRTAEFVLDVEAFTPADLVARWGDQCFYCGGEWTVLDHMKHVMAGGCHTVENCRPACSGCNSVKGVYDKLVVADYRAAQARMTRAIEAALDFGNWHRINEGKVA